MDIQEAAIAFKETRDTKAFNVIYDYIYKCNKFVSQKYKTNKGSDLSHDIALTVLEKIDSYDPNRALFITWMSRIITNKYNRNYALDKRFSDDVDVEADKHSTGKKTVTESYTPDYDYITMEDELTAEDVWESTQEYISNLTALRMSSLVDEQHKYVLIQCLLRRRHYEDVAEEVETTVPVIKNIIFKNKKLIKRYIEDKYLGVKVMP